MCIRDSIDRNCYQNGYILKLSAPVAAQIDPIHVDIGVPPTLQRTVPPILDVDIRFLVQFTDGRWRHLAAPQGLGDILHTPDGYACQVQDVYKRQAGRQASSAKIARANEI